MTEKELKLQNELLQKQNKELKADNCKLCEQIKELTEQVTEFKFQQDLAQAINIVNNRK